MEESLEILKKIYVKFLDTAQSLLFVASIFLFLYIFVIQPHEVSGLSMFPTFHNQDFLLSYLLDVKTNSLRRGDVVVFHAPYDVEKLYIKRIIGMPGDIIKIEGGKVYKNDVLLDEKAYLNETVETYGGSYLRDGQAITVPAGTIFVMGDNRPYSSDSREWGPLDEKKLIGRSMMRVWPMNTFVIIPRDPYK